MDNNEEKELIVQWPFYRYKVLIPEQIKGDLFVWLYLSLIVFKNNELKIDKRSYTSEVVTSVKNILKSKFSSVISTGEESNLDKIVYKAEESYVQEVNGEKKLINEVFSFVDTYGELFSDKLQVRNIYQDAITGAVLPFFDTNLYVDESMDKKNELPVTNKMEKPSKNSIKRAYNQYNNLLKNNRLDIENADNEQPEEVDEFDPFDNPDDTENAFFETLNDDIEEEHPVKNNKSFNSDNFNVVYLENSKVKMLYDVRIHNIEGTIVSDSPFGTKTDVWMNSCFNKAKNICSVLEHKLSNFDFGSTKDDKAISASLKFPERMDIADSLFYCGPLYRLVKSLDNKNLLEIVLKLDSYLKNKNPEGFYVNIGKYLECIIQDFELTKKEDREQYSYQFYCDEIKNNCGVADCNRFTTKKIFDDWQKSWQAFKADFCDLMIFQGMSTCNGMYKEFVNDVLELYDDRNEFSHFNNNQKKLPSKSHIDMLLKVTKVFSEIY